MISDPRYDFISHKSMQRGNCISLNVHIKNQSYRGSSLKDILYAPFKIIRAVIGWLDFLYAALYWVNL